jgi:sterol 3beta-glucosyltransferase
MRAVITNFGSRGDFEPLVALGWELSSHGWDTIIAAPPFAKGIIPPSHKFVPIGPDLLNLRDSINLALSTHANLYASEQGLLELLAPFQPCFGQIYRELSDVCRDADVLISGPVQPLARIVHETTGIPFVSIQLCNFGGSGGPVLRECGNSLINSFRQDIGLPAILDPLTTGANSQQLALYAMSRYLRPRAENWPSHYHLTGFFFLPEELRAPEEALATFIASGTPPVVFTFGSMRREDDGNFRDMLVEVMRRIHKRAVFQGFRPPSGQAGRDPDFFWTDFAPHLWLFTRAACVVLHGGAGTSAVVFRSGVPGVFVPHGDFYDQRYWAQLACDLGCAVKAMMYAEVTPEKLELAIRESTENKPIRQAAADLAVRIRTERGVETARHLIESLIRRIGLSGGLN